MNKFGFEPDFDNLRTVLLGGRGHRVPNIELVIDREIKDGFMGREITTVEDEIAFRHDAGYDYAWLSIGMVDPAGTMNKDRVEDQKTPRVNGKDDRLWAEEHAGVIQTRDDVERFPWPEPEAVDFSPFANGDALLPKGMRFIAVLGKIFTASWQLLGYERFCTLMCEDPEFVDDIVGRVGAIQLEVCRRVLEYDSVGAIWTPDDIAYNTGPMAPPQWLDERVFPYYREMAKLARAKDKPHIYHSDGDLWPVMDMILGAGFNALHPIEPESMEIGEVREATRGTLCLLGNIRVDTLSQGSVEQVSDLVKDRIVRFGYEGGYCVGSSNSVPNYVPLENYMAMLETSAEFGRMPAER
jgi:uroporphyrinogen decarboxylase